MVKEKIKKIFEPDLVILSFGFSVGILLFGCSISNIGNNTNPMIPLEIMGLVLFLSLIAPALEKSINGIVNTTMGNIIGFGLTALLLIEGGKMTAEVLRISEIYLQIFAILIVITAICFLIAEWLTRLVEKTTTNSN